MNIEKFYEGLKDIQLILESKGLPSSEVYAHVNWLGDEIRVTVKAEEYWEADDNFWHREKNFDGGRTQSDLLLNEARSFAYALPNEEDRVIELMIQKLNKIADQLPKGTSEIAVAAWGDIFNMLKERAESISKNGLPSPESVGDIEEVR